MSIEHVLVVELKLLIGGVETNCGHFARTGGEVGRGAHSAARHPSEGAAAHFGAGSVGRDVRCRRRCAAVWHLWNWSDVLFKRTTEIMFV